MNTKDLQLRPQIERILQDNGYPADQRFYNVLASKITRNAEGGLDNVEEALQLMRRACPHPNRPAEKKTSYRPENQPTDLDHTPVDPGLETNVRHYFGNRSSAQAANQLALQNNGLYQQYKATARRLGLVG
jgi:hypothetical protein